MIRPSFVVTGMASILLALSCAAQQSPAARVLDLTASDGVKLKATFFGYRQAGSRRAFAAPMQPSAQSVG